MRAAAGVVAAGRGPRTPTPAAADTISSPAFGFASAAAARAGPSGWSSCETSPSAPSRRAKQLVARRRLADEDDVDGRVAVEPAREGRGIVVGVDHPGAVRGRHELVREDVLQPRDLTHRRLAVVGAEDDGVALEELVAPPAASISVPTASSQRRGARAPRPAPARARRSRSRRDRRRGSRSRPGSRATARPPLRRRRCARAAVAHRQRRAGHVRLEEVVEEEAARAVRRTGEEGHGRPVWMPAAVAGDVDRSCVRPASSSAS